MENYKIDNRNRNDLLGTISEHAASYTPEWNFDVSNPDATSVIGLIFANQTLNNIKKFNQLFTKYHIEFANMYGVSLKSATPAKSVCVFNISENIHQGSELKRGTQLVGTNGEGDEIIFALCHDICVTTAQITDLLCISGSRKYLNVYDGGDIKLFDYSGVNSYRQAIVMEFNKLPQLNDNELFIKFDGNIPSRMFAGIFGDRDGYRFKYEYEGELLNFEDVSVEGDFIRLKYDGENDKLAIILEQEKPLNEDFILDNVELFIKGGDDKVSFLWNGKNEIIEDVFMPFTNQPVLYNEFYIGDEFLFEQYGAKAVLRFNLDFDKYKADDGAVYEEDLRVIKKKPKTLYGRPHYSSYVQEVSVDYFNGKGWKRLETDKDMTVIFSNEQNAGEYEVSFKIPLDWEPVVVGGYEGNCIRIQVIAADNCYMNGVEYCYPIISSLSLHMDSQIKGISPSELSYIHGQVREDGISNAFRSMEYDGDYMFIGLDKKLVNGPVAMFADLHKTYSFNGLELEYSYSSAKGFKPLKVVDDTEMFHNSGLIMFMPPADMDVLEVEGDSKYWIRIEDKNRYFSKQGNCVPLLRNLYLNAAYVENAIVKEEQDYYIDLVMSYMKFPLYAQNILSAQIWVNEKEQLSNEEMARLIEDEKIDTRIVYNLFGEIDEFYVLWQEVDSFDEVRENRRCYCIDRNRNEVLFGDGVTSYVPQNTLGVAFKARVICCDGEKANIAPYAIDRFRSTVISIEDVSNPIGAYGGTDIEDVNDALVRGSNILSSRKRLVSKDDYIKETYLFSDTIEQVACVTDNAVSLVLLMRDYKKGDYSFRNIRERLKEHLIEHCEMTCGPHDIQICEPIFVKISIDLWISVSDMSKSLEIKQLWLERITNYLEPTKQGKTAGWQIGKLPSSKQIRLLLSTLETTATIENINIMASYTQDGRYHEVSIERIEKNPFMICCNGTHNIYI